MSEVKFERRKKANMENWPPRCSPSSAVKMSTTGTPARVIPPSLCLCNGNLLHCVDPGMLVFPSCVVTVSAPNAALHSRFWGPPERKHGTLSRLRSSARLPVTCVHWTRGRNHHDGTVFFRSSLSMNGIVVSLSEGRWSVQGWVTLFKFMSYTNWKR